MSKDFSELSDKVPARLVDALKRYQDALDKLRTCFSGNNHSEIQTYVYEVLKSRDAVQKALSDNAPCPGVVLTILVKLDSDLKQQAKKIAQVVDLAECRASMYPSENTWWWLLDQDSNWFWRLLTILFLQLTFAGIIYIFPRLYSGGPDLWGALYSILIVALTLPGVQSALQSLPSSVEQFMIKAGIPAHHLNKATAIFTIIPCIIVYSVIIASPLIAESYRERGFRRYVAGLFGAALGDYNRALALQPDDTTTHYYLGLLHEDLQNLPSARAAYQMAERSCQEMRQNVCAKSLNNLARLYIVDEAYNAAMSVLVRLERQKSVDDAKLRFYIAKNKGWALLAQGHFAEAEASLLDAIDVVEKLPFDVIKKPERAPAYCLLAQVLDKRHASDEQSCVYWQKCFEYNDLVLPEDNLWYYMAQKRLCRSDVKNP